MISFSIQFFGMLLGLYDLEHLFSFSTGDFTDIRYNEDFMCMAIKRGLVGR